MTAAFSRSRRYPYKDYATMRATILTFLLGILLCATAALSETVAYPENRLAPPGELWATITGVRKGLDEYSSKIVGSPVTIHEGTTIDSIWFVIAFTGDDDQAALAQGIFRAGISTAEHFKNNPLGMNQENLWAAKASVSGTRVGEEGISVTTLPELPGYYLIGLAFDEAFTATITETFFIWANVEYRHTNNLVILPQFSSAQGADVQVTQQKTIRELGYTSMIWLESGEPFIHPAQYSMTVIGSKKKGTLFQKPFVTNKVFSSRVFSVAVQGSGQDVAFSPLEVYLTVQGATCSVPLVRMTSDKSGNASALGLAPRIPRKRLSVDFEVRSESRTLDSRKVTLIRRGFKKKRKRKLRRRQIEKICSRFRQM